MNIGWYTTAPHPWRRAHVHGADQGQVGWRLHAVPVDAEGKPEKREQALCGVRPRHGWGLDAFIDAECSRCTAIMEKRETTGAVFVDVVALRSAQAEGAWQAGVTAAHEGRPSGANPYPQDARLSAQWARGHADYTRGDA